MKIVFRLLILFCLTSSIVHGQVPQLLEYDGFLSGNITGNRTMGVRLYNASTKGTLLYKETIGTIKVTQGQFYFQYGQNGTLGNGTTPTTISAVLTGSQNWLGITVNGTEQSPRERLLSVPFALKANESADAQKINSDLRQVVDAVGKVVVAFGGNASNLVSNPTATIATMESTAKNVLEMQKRFRVIGLFGNLSFGNSSTSRSFTISNTGFDRLNVSGISYPAGFSGNWSGVVPAGGSQIVAVAFAPSAVQAYSGNITVSSDAVGGVSVLPVSGTGARPISVQGNLTFGNVTINTTATRNFTISNTGTMNLTVTGITYPPRFSGSWSGTIPPGGSQTITATYAPNAAQTNSGNLSVASNASGGSGILAVNGAGILAGAKANMVTVQGGTLPQFSQLAGQTVSTFQIGKYEVTWGEWKEVRDWAVANGYTDLAGVGDTYPAGSADNFPVINVSWYDVCKWSNARSEKEGLTPVYQVSGATYKMGQSVPTVNSGANGYRLPLEKEWEWAARGGVSSQGYTYSGSNDVNAVAWSQNNSDGGTKAVGTKAGNELGIYDMSGNAWEWCWDVFVPYSSSYRRIRGGSWDLNADNCTVAVRDIIFYPDDRDISIGFRLARSSGN